MLYHAKINYWEEYVSSDSLTVGIYDEDHIKEAKEDLKTVAEKYCFQSKNGWSEPSYDNGSINFYRKKKLNATASLHIEPIEINKRIN